MLSPLVMIVGLGAVVALGLLIAFLLRRVVPTNMVDIVQYRNKTVSYGKDNAAGNVYYEWPSFLPRVGVTVVRLPVSVFDVTLQNYAAYDAGRLPFVVDIMAFFRIEDSNVAANRVANFQELQQQLIGVLQGAVRVTLAKQKLEEIMEQRSELGEAFTGSVQEQLKEWGVTPVKNIEFMDLRDASDSVVIQNIMAKEQSRIDRESRETVADNNRSASEREIEAQRQIDLQQQQATEQVGIRTAEQEQKVGIATERSKQEVLTQAQETKTREMQVKQIEDVRTAEIARDVATVTAEQDRKVMVVNAEANRDQLQIVAEGRLEESRRDAEGVRIRGEAEGKAKEAVNMADVTPQIALAKEIGSNEGYQGYLVGIERVRATRDIGVAQAEALEAADIKVIASGGTVTSGISSITDLFTATGGAAVGAALEGLAQTEAGQKVLDKLTGTTDAPDTPPPAKKAGAK